MLNQVPNAFININQKIHLNIKFEAGQKVSKCQIPKYQTSLCLCGSGNGCWTRTWGSSKSGAAAAHGIFTWMVLAANAAFMAARTCGANAFASLLVASRRTVARWGGRNAFALREVMQRGPCRRYQINHAIAIPISKLESQAVTAGLHAVLDISKRIFCKLECSILLLVIQKRGPYTWCHAQDQVKVSIIVHVGHRRAEWTPALWQSTPDQVFHCFNWRKHINYIWVFIVSLFHCFNW